MVSYHPVMLKSLAEICDTFGVGPERVRTWVQEGAPVAIEEDDRGNRVRYRAEMVRLYLWLEARRKSPVPTGRHLAEMGSEA